jgi:hypothetical protein
MSDPNTPLPSFSELVEAQLSGKPITPKPKKPKKTIADQLKDVDALQVDLPQAGDKPPWTGYNSWEGSLTVDPWGVNPIVYRDQQVKLDRTKANCPMKTDAKWAEDYEKFHYYKLIVEKDGSYKYVKRLLPAHLNKFDLRVMDLLHKYQKLLILTFRGSHKSTNILRYIKRCIADMGKTVTYLSWSADLALDYANQIQDEFTTNKEMLRDYGFMINEDKGNRKAKMYFLSQNPSIRQPGLNTGSSQGKSVVGGHPDVIVADDPVGEEVEESKKLLKHVQRWWTKQILPMASESTQIVVAGTIKDANDLYAFIEKANDGFHIEKIAAIKIWPNDGQMDSADRDDGVHWYYQEHIRSEDNQREIVGVYGLRGGEVGMDEFNMSKWGIPGRAQYFLDNDPKKGFDGNLMSMQEFLLIRRSIGKEAFASEYQMEVTNLVSGMLKFDRLQWFDWNSTGIPPKQVILKNVHSFFDMAFGSSARSDKNVIATVGEYMGCYFIIDLEVWQGGGVTEKIRRIKEVKKKHPYTCRFGVEADFANSEDAITIKTYFDNNPSYNIFIDKIEQNAFKRSKDEKELRDMGHAIINFDSVDIPATKRSKASRIFNQWNVKLEYYKIWIFGGIATDALDEFRTQWGFPSIIRFDVLDAVGSCFDLCGDSNIDNFYCMSG